MAGKKPTPKASAKAKKPVHKAAAKPVKAAPAKSKTAAAAPKAAASRAVGSRPVAAKAIPAPLKIAAPLPKARPVPTGPIARAVRTSAPLPPDDPNNEDGHSLLAGPRNVKPYVAKRGERYMNKVQLEHFQNILQSWKRDLMVEVDRTVTHMKDEAANFPDPNDRATQEEEFSLELRTRDRERKLIRKIEEALMRIEGGSYGYCLETGEEIGIKRLEARPVATLTIEAQERRERRERQYGERDDRYR
jgi:DnaK suppressor protein